MSSPETTLAERRQQLLERLTYQLSRRFSTRTVLFHAAVAERMGLSQSDHKALDFVYEAEDRGARLTAGQLAHATGLTTGAVTGVVDRLERAGLLRRVPDAQDRRRVVLEATHARDDELWAHLSEIAQQTAEMMERYSDAELELITDYVVRLIELTEQATLRLRARDRKP